MKRSFLIFTLVILSLHSCTDKQLQAFKDVTDVVLSEEGPTSALSNDEVIAGLKEALVQGTTKGIGLASATDGFLKNEMLFIPFPDEAKVVKEKALQLGLTNQVNTFEETMNRAAEAATKEAGDIFKNAILEMTIADGFAILKGDDNAATKYLKEKTTAQLTERFRPKVQGAIEQVELTKYWEPLVTAYNTATLITGGEDVNPDLTGYVTERAVSGLFVHIEAEEKNIRANPTARATELLQKVFGSIGQ